MSKKSLPFDMSKFNKTGGDKHSTVLTHKDGHSITLVHSALSPEMRAAIESVPAKGDKKPEKLADGGQVKKFSNPQEEQNAKDIQKGVYQDDPIVAGVKHAWSALTTPTPSSNYAQGGKIVKQHNPKLAESKKEPGTPYQLQQIQAMQESQAPSNQPSQMQKSPPQMLADGGEVSSKQPAADDFSDVQQAAPQEAAPQPQADTGNIAPTEQKIDPMLQQKRDMYNKIVSGSNFNDPTAGSVDPKFRELQFGPNGEAPKNFSSTAWQQAEQLNGMQNSKDIVNTAAQLAQQQQDNQARIQAGLAPAPAPGSNQSPENTPQLASKGPAPAGTPDAQAPNSQGQQSPQSDDPMGYGSMAQSYNNAFNTQIQGAKIVGNALSQQGAADAQIAKDNAEAQQAITDHYKSDYSNLDKERQGFMEDIANQHIDPNHYLNSQGVGSKIATGIGLILGGIGGGLMGTENPALKMLQSNIDRDIEAQKANLGKSQNLLSANLHQFGNMRDATDMTRIMQNDVVANKLKAAAGTAQSEAAKGNAMQAYGAIMQQNAQIQGQMAMRRTLVNATNAVQQNPDKVPALINTLRNSPIPGGPEQAKALEERYVPGIGVASVPVPESVRQQFVSHKAVNDLMNKSLEFSKQYGGKLSSILDPKVRAEAATIQNQLIGSVKQAQHDGVYKPAEAHFLESQIGGSPASFFANMSSVPKIREMQQIKQQEYGELQKTYGLNGGALPQSQESSNQPQIKTMGGVKYQKVAGGWKKL